MLCNNILSIIYGTLITLRDLYMVILIFRFNQFHSKQNVRSKTFSDRVTGRNPEKMRNPTVTNSKSYSHYCENNSVNYSPTIRRVDFGTNGPGVLGWGKIEIRRNDNQDRE